MIKVTVLYNLPEGVDEEAFLRWRTTDHNAANAEAPGVLKSDFYRVLGPPLLGQRAATVSAPYRFITESYWIGLETFEAAWNRFDEQARLVTAVGRIADALFLVSEEIQSTMSTPDGPVTTQSPFGVVLSPAEPLAGSPHY